MLDRTDRLAVGAIAAGAALSHVLVSALVVLVTPLAPPEALGDSDARTVIRFVDVEPEGATVILHRKDQRARYHVTDGSSVGFDEEEFVGLLATPGRLGPIRAEFEVLRGGVAVGHGSIDAFRPRIEVSGSGFGVRGL